MVFTFPKVLRAFFRPDRRLYGEISKLAYRMIQRFYNSTAGRRVQSASVIAYASAGEFARKKTPATTFGPALLHKGIEDPNDTRQRLDIEGRESGSFRHSGVVKIPGFDGGR
jgi:hypothetical protein